MSCSLYKFIIDYEKVFFKNTEELIKNWNELFEALIHDVDINGWSNRKLPWKRIKNLIINNKDNVNMTKNLPAIKCKSECKNNRLRSKNIVAKWLCYILFGNKPDKSSGKTYRLYRKLKTNETI